MNIVVGVPAVLDPTVRSGFFEAYSQLRKALLENGNVITTYSPSGGDVQIGILDKFTSDDYTKDLKSEARDENLLNQYQNTIALSKDFSDKICDMEYDQILAFNSMGLFVNKPYLYYTSTLPYKRVLRLVEDEYPKGNHPLSGHFAKLLDYYRFVAENERENYLKADKIILFSHKIKQAIVQEHGIDPEKIYYLPRPIPNFGFKDNDLQQARFLKRSHGDMKIILMPAQLRVMKGIKYAIETMKIVKGKIKNAVLIICGSINKYEEDYIKELLQDAKGKANIVVAGFLPKDKLYSYMQTADCAFMPFCFDECPIALTECIGHGLPVVTNEYAGYERSVIDTFGYCARQNDVEDYADGIIRLLTDKEYNMKKRSGTLRVAKQYDLERFKEEVANVFR